MALSSLHLSTLAAWLDRELAVARFQDHAHNGLQVANRTGRVRRVCVGVDATLPFFEAAAARGADLAIVHHGLSWDDSLKRITGLNYRLLACLIGHNLALWACHLPLDAHPRLGNNACLARALGLRRCRPFGAYRGQTIGVRGELPRALPFEAFCERVRQRINPDIRALAAGSGRVRRVGIVSGGGCDAVPEAAAAGLDVFLTGESVLWACNVAQQEGLNVVFAGHYATETFGVRALAGRIRRRWGVPAEFLDCSVPF
jgi:dinuclear metal center YbgI/SA1388 family protein